MISRRKAIISALGLLAVGAGATPARAADPTATLNNFYKVLLAVMRDGPTLGFKGRFDRLSPAVRQAYDLPLMTRLVVGLGWQSISPPEQQQLVDAFSDFSIANYASQFDDYSGESFEVSPKVDPAPGGDVVVRTKLVQTNDKPVELDYLLRNSSGGWHIIDVYLNGTVSQLATRRSEFSSVLRQQGVGGLIALLKQRTSALATSSH
jgi:phospholipid transport system substrate-binding protein